MSPRARRQHGFTYLGLLFAIAIMGAVLAAAGELWHTARQREKEAQLLFVGDAFRRAIGLYYERTPGTVKHFPKTLDDLLRDNRYLTVQRYLRQIYPDPMTGKPDWGLVRAPDGGIMGVHSKSGEKPLKVGNFETPEDRQFTGKTKYSEWVFAYAPAAAQTQTQPAKPSQTLPPAGAAPTFSTGTFGSSAAP